MNFQKSWDIDFQKFLDRDIFFDKFKIFKNLRNYVLILFLDNRFCVVDFVDIVYFVDFVELLKTSEKELTFIFLIQSILFSG